MRAAVRLPENVSIFGNVKKNAFYSNVVRVLLRETLALIRIKSFKKEVNRDIPKSFIGLRGVRDGRGVLRTLHG